MLDRVTLAGDRAGKAHWDTTWQQAGVPMRVAAIDGPGRWNHVNRGVARFLTKWAKPGEPCPRLIELGCARSIWLPFFAGRLGYSVTGLDYSELGCELARTTLAAANTEGTVVLGDFFDPPSDLVRQFDTAFSLGVAEHFDDTGACIAAFSRFLKVGGRLITIIPNMTGVPGTLQKFLNQPVYDKHIPLDRTGLAVAHQAAGLRIVDAGYLFSTNFGVLNLTGVPTGTASWAAKRLLMAALARMSLLGWQLEPVLPAVQLFAAYVYCVADKP